MPADSWLPYLFSLEEFILFSSDSLIPEIRQAKESNPLLQVHQGPALTYQDTFSQVKENRNNELVGSREAKSTMQVSH